MFFGVIVAGGTGTRMGANMPKQFLDLAGQPIIIHTLHQFLKNTSLDQIYMGIHPDWVDYMKELTEHYIEEEQRSRVHFVSGGKERNDTIMNVIAQIEKDYGKREDHFIITQDGVRPFVTQKMIEDHVHALACWDAVDTAIPAVDTIIVSEDGTCVSDIPERKYLYQSQTPQSFRMGLLKQLYTQLSEDEKQRLTDACKICTVQGIPVHIVSGDVKNMKITTMTDYKMACLMADQWKE